MRESNNLESGVMRGKVLWTIGILLAVGIAAVIYVVVRGTGGDDPQPPVASPSPTATDGATSPAEPTNGSSGVDEVPVKPIPTPDPISPDPGQDDNPPVEEQPTGGAADVVMTYGLYDAPTSSVVVSGYVGNAVEDGGVCTLTLTQGSSVVTAETSGAADARTTSCGALSIDRSRLSAGTWSAVLGYASSTTTGASTALMIEVQ